MAVNDLSGVARKTRKGKCETRPVDTSDAVSQGTKESNTVPGSGIAVISESLPNSYPSTPKRSRRQARQTREQCLTSTPIRNSTHFVSNVLKSRLRAKQVEQDYNELITQVEVFDSILLVNVISAFLACGSFSHQSFF